MDGKKKKQQPPVLSKKAVKKDEDNEDFEVVPNDAIKREVASSS